MIIRVTLSPTQENTAKRLLNESEERKSVADYLADSLLVVLDDLAEPCDEPVKNSGKSKTINRKRK